MSLGTSTLISVGVRMSDSKRTATNRFAVGRALRSAQQVSIGELSDPSEAIRELARAVAALAQAVEDLLDAQELEKSASV